MPLRGVREVDEMERIRADYCVVGAGFAGLAAALRLKDRGTSVALLEARDRVGGRVWNHDLGGGKVSERGGTFVGPTQDHVMALASQLGVGTFPTYDDGDAVYVNGSDRMTYSDTGPTGSAPPDPLILPELTAVVALLDQMATEVPVDAPWTAQSAEDWDSQTLKSWIDSHSATPRFKQVVPIATRPIFGAEPRELSLLFTLFYIAASGDENNPGTFERNFDTRNGAQMSRFVGGSQVIATKIAKQLGARVVLSSPVRQIRPGHDQRQAGDRGDSADSRGADRLRADPSVPARPADPTLRPGHDDQGRRRLQVAILARRRPQRDGGHDRRPGHRDVRRLAPERHPGRDLRVRRRRLGPPVQRDVPRRPQGGRAHAVRHVLRLAGLGRDRLL
jgi:monoamine oxidase